MISGEIKKAHPLYYRRIERLIISHTGHAQLTVTSSIDPEERCARFDPHTLLI